MVDTTIISVNSPPLIALQTSVMRILVNMQGNTVKTSAKKVSANTVFAVVPTGSVDA